MHTPGPWKTVAQYKKRARLGQRYDVMGEGFVASDMQLEDALLIAAAPDLLSACEAQHQAIDILFALLIELDRQFFPSKSGTPWEAIVQGNAAIAKAKGEREDA